MNLPETGQAICGALLMLILSESDWVFFLASANRARETAALFGSMLLWAVPVGILVHVSISVLPGRSGWPPACALLIAAAYVFRRTHLRARAALAASLPQWYWEAQEAPLTAGGIMWDVTGRLIAVWGLFLLGQAMKSGWPSGPYLIAGSILLTPEWWSLEPGPRRRWTSAIIGSLAFLLLAAPPMRVSVWVAAVLSVWCLARTAVRVAASTRGHTS